jgi:transposase
MAGKRYGKEFQDEACKLVSQQGYTQRKAAQELGISVDRLKYWLRRRGLIQSPEPADWPETDDPKLLKAQIRELQKQLRRSETEKEILKKATAFFASQTP